MIVKYFRIFLYLRAAVPTGVPYRCIPEVQTVILPLTLMCSVSGDLCDCGSKTNDFQSSVSQSANHRGLRIVCVWPACNAKCRSGSETWDKCGVVWAGNRPTGLEWTGLRDTAAESRLAVCCCCRCRGEARSLPMFMEQHRET